LDGFIKQGEECFAILPPVYKVLQTPMDNKKQQRTESKGKKVEPSIIGNAGPLAAELQILQSNGMAVGKERETKTQPQL